MLMCMLAGYKATKLELHAPAEHKIEGTSYDAELQMYFEMKDDFLENVSDERKRAAVAFFLTTEEGAGNNAFPRSVGSSRRNLDREGR